MWVSLVDSSASRDSSAGLKTRYLSVTNQPDSNCFFHWCRQEFDQQQHNLDNSRQQMQRMQLSLTPWGRNMSMLLNISAESQKPISLILPIWAYVPVFGNF